MNVQSENEMQSRMQEFTGEGTGRGGKRACPLNASFLDDVSEGSTTAIGSSLGTSVVVPLVFINDAVQCDGHQKCGRKAKSNSSMVSIVSAMSSMTTTLRSSCFGSLHNMLGTTLQVPEHMIIPRGRIQLQRSQVLGKGAFGEVVRGKLYASSGEVGGPEFLTEPREKYFSLSPSSLSNMLQDDTLANAEGSHAKQGLRAGRGCTPTAGHSGDGDDGGVTRHRGERINNNNYHHSCVSGDVAITAQYVLGNSISVEAFDRYPVGSELDIQSVLISMESSNQHGASNTDVLSVNGDRFSQGILQGVLGNGSKTTVEESTSDALVSSPSEGQPVTVAVKTVSKARLSRRQKYITSFNVELHLASTLHHPSLIDVYGVVEDDTELFLVMDIAEGGTVLDYIKTHDHETVVVMAPHFIADVVLGLEYLQSLGIAHRDVKPCNMLLDSEYHVKLADFGSACYLSDRVANNFGGTAAYMSPEMVGTGMASATSDLWALGCVLFELLVGRSVFQGENHMFVMRRIKEYQNDNIDWPESLSLPAKDLLQRLLRRDPDDRLGSEATGGFSVLKAHPFFERIDWCNLHNAPKNALQCAEYYTILNGVLVAGENLVRCSKVLKKSRCFLRKEWRTRLLVLTDIPRLLYIDATTYAIELSLPLTSELYVEVRDAERFRIVTKRRKYDFIDPEKCADLWGMCINDAVKGLHAVVDHRKNSGESMLYKNSTTGSDVGIGEALETNRAFSLRK